MRLKRLLTAMLLGVAFSFCLTLTYPAYGQDVIGEVNRALGKANPVTIALGGLVDRAVDSGNVALQQRLDQLNGILQSAIFNLNQVLKENIDRLDSAARQQRVETIRQLGQLIDRINALLQTDFDHLEAILSQNIQTLQNGLANSLASLPIPIEPLVNIGRSGITLIRQQGDVTRLTLTGSGLFKSSFTPIATLIQNGQETSLKVEAASMGLILIAIPNSVLPTGTVTTDYVLKLTLKKGGLPWSRSYPSFPVHVCGGVPRYTFDATLSYTGGKGWDRRIADQGKMYKDCPGDPDTFQIVAKAPDPWEVDKDQGVGGLIIGQTGGDNYHSEQFLPGTSTYQLYCAKNGGRGSNSWAYVSFAQKKRKDISECGKSEFSNVPLPYGAPKQVQFNLVQALGNCDPNLATPSQYVSIKIKDTAGRIVETLGMSMPYSNKKTSDNAISFSIDEHGLLNAAFSPTCAIRYSYVYQ